MNKSKVINNVIKLSVGCKYYEYEYNIFIRLYIFCSKNRKGILAYNLYSCSIFAIIPISNYIHNL